MHQGQPSSNSCFSGFEQQTTDNDAVQNYAETDSKDQTFILIPTHYIIRMCPAYICIYMLKFPIRYIFSWTKTTKGVLIPESISLCSFTGSKKRNEKNYLLHC